MKDETPWLVLALGDASAPPNVFRVLCKRCEGTEDIPLPLAVREIEGIYKRIVQAHKECREPDSAT